MTDEHGLIGRVFGLKDDTLFGDVDSLEGNLVVDEHHSNFAVLDGGLPTDKYQIPVHNAGVPHAVALHPEAKVDLDAVIAKFDVIAVLFCRQYWLAGCDTAQNGDTLSAQIAIILSSQQVRFT